MKKRQIYLNLDNKSYPYSNLKNAKINVNNFNIKIKTPILVLFFCFLQIFLFNFNGFNIKNFNINNASSYNFENKFENNYYVKNYYAFQNKYNYEFYYQNKVFKFNEDDFKNLNLSDYQKKIKEENLDKISLIKKLNCFGLKKEEIINYVFPEALPIYEKLNSSIGRSAVPEKIEIIENTCSLNFVKGRKGQFINKIDFYENFYNQVMSGKEDIKFELKVNDYELSENLASNFVEKGCFSTNFSSSSETRKNNIKVALSSFDGIVLDEGEILSFNKTTGVRSESSGYMPAKIITGGTYTLGYGGGVCQVSTTLYNACLLAGLEILEVNNHSLPVSYVEPSFDAMVNSGSSDLVIRNNTNGKIIITTSYKNDICKIKIFGKKNLYKITRSSEKTKIIKANGDKVDTDYEKYGLNDLEIGEEKRISYAKDGFYSKGYLNYYDTNGNLIETRKIRENKYNPTIGVVVRREY